MKNKSLVTFILCVVILGVSFILYKSAQNAPLDTIAADSVTTYSKDTEIYKIEAAYPSGKDVSRGAQAQMESFVMGMVQEIENDATEFYGDAPEPYPAFGAYTLYIDYETYTYEDLTSYVFTISDYRGGAHPNGYYKTFTFDSSGKEYMLSDILSGNYLNILSEKTKEQVEARMVLLAGEGAEASLWADGYAPNQENFKNFYLTETELVILIPPYQVAAYAAGSFEVHIPLEELALI